LKLNRLLAGTLALVLIAGFVSPAFAVIDNFGNTDEVLPSSPLNTRQETVFSPEAVNIATNGDFETGDFTGWTQFTTANGITNPAVVPFDTDGDTVATNSAQFRVGDAVFTGIEEGGGIFQIITTGGGTVTIKADIASDLPLPPSTTTGNDEGGVFTLFFDGVEVDSHTFGSLFNGDTKRSTLNAVINGVSPGSHEVKFQMTRPFTESMDTPRQYIDDVMVLAEPVVVGGQIIPIESTSLILAGAQSFSWMIPVVLSVVGIGLFVVSRKSE